MSCTRCRSTLILSRRKITREVGFMMVRKSERASCYLGFQRLFDFPRSSFAPISLRFRLGVTKGFKDEFSTAIRKHSSGKSFSGVRSQGTEVLLPPLARYFTARSSNDRRSTVGRATSDARGEFAPHLSTKLIEDQLADPVQTRWLPPQLLDGTAPSRKTPSTDSKAARFPVSPSKNWSQTPAVGSRLSHWLSAAGSSNIQHSFAPVATLRSGDSQSGSESTMPSFSDSWMPLPQRRLIDELTDHTNERANIEARGEKGAKPVLSTLHIDGSSLGRWALQHLERSLGKPTAGMTGIDPRATPPRSRVSPF